MIAKSARKAQFKRKIYYNANIVDVFNLRVYRGWFSVVNGYFEFVEKGNSFKDFPGTYTNLKRAYAVPGLIDAHMHIESSLLVPQRFVEAVAKHGTVAVLQDSHEMANVFGMHGVKFMMRSAKNNVVRIYHAVPSCIPPTRALLETCNFKFTASDVARLAAEPNVIALGEVMDYRGLLTGEKELLDIIQTAKILQLKIEGHCPSLRGYDLSRYIALGVRSDHTLTNPEKITEELQKGMYIMLQPKSLTKENVKLISQLKDRTRIILVTDDTLPTDLLKGHLNRVVNLAISQGWDSIDAIASATIRPAQYLGIPDLGAIAPGMAANFFITKSLKSLTPIAVFILGKRVSGKIFEKYIKIPSKFINAIKIRNLFAQDFRIVFNRENKKYLINILVINEDCPFTKITQKIITLQGGYPNIDDEEDLAIIAVFYRYNREPQGSVGLIKGLGLKQGAFCSSFAHDSHNLLVIGKTPNEMATAANMVINSGGGMAVSNGKKNYLLELPVGGLMSTQPVEKVARKLKMLEKVLIKWGLKVPLSRLLTLTLTTSPYYKISDKGIVDVEQRRIIPIILDEGN
jgi:adenine deaminase